MRSYTVYILRCCDESYYTGVTNNYKERVSQHQDGIDIRCYTYGRRPVELVYLAEFGDINEAISWEKQVKRWSRKKKEDLIYNEGKMLGVLACMTQNWEIAVRVRKFRFLVMVSLTNHRQENIEGCRPSSGSG